MDSTVESSRPNFARRLKETLDLFDLSPEKYPFDDRRVTKIVERRKQLRGQLFFDYLLQQAGISKPAKLFPPPTPKHFQVLIREILSSDWGVSEVGGLSQEVNEFSQDTTASRNTPKNLQAGIKRACLIYYLLAWWDDEAHLKYSETMRLASQFTELTHAHFLFDIGVTANAASLLCTPLITSEPDLVQKVFYALSIATDADPSVLILRYARMAKPDLKPQEVLFSYVDALAKVNFMEAWSYQRTFQDAQRIEILKRIYLAILNPRPLRTALQLLSVLPLQVVERDFLHEYALRPPPEIPEHSVSALHSLIILRLTVEGEYSTAVKINREFSQLGEKLLNAASAEESRSYSMDARSRPGMLIAQKAEESREMLRESVSLLPLEHRRQLESQLSDGGLSATASFANPNASNSGMEMSWEAVTAPLGVTPMHSTPPRGSSPAMPGGAHARSPIVIPSSPTKGPSSAQKKSPLVSKFQMPSTPIDTQTLGRVFKPPTPKRTGLMSYMTPLRTPMVANKASGVMGSVGGVDLDRSGAPPPTTGRAGSKNAFFDPDVRAVKGLILPSGSSPLSADRGKTKGRVPMDDVEMRDVGAGDDTESEEEVLGALDGQSDESFVYAPPPRSNTTGGLMTASSIVALKKMQEREREAKERERERAATRDREMAAKRARLEQQRQNLGNDSSFTSAGSAAGKRKRDGEDDMGRSDEEMQDADVSAGRGKRKSDGGLVQVVRKPVPATVAPVTIAPLLPSSMSRVISVPIPAQSAASVSSRGGALIPPTTIAPSVTSAGAPPSGSAADAPRRSSRISTASGESATGGSQAGSIRAPSATPSAGNQTEDDEEVTSPQMPGAFILEDEGSVPPPRKTRGAKPSSSKPASKSKAAAKPASKIETTSTRPPTRQTRSKRNVSSLASIPTAITEDEVLETVDEDEPITQSPSKGKGRGKRGGSVGPAKKSGKAVVEDTTEGDTDDATERRRSSRRLTALAGGVAEGGSAGSASGGRKSGRKA